MGIILWRRLGLCAACAPLCPQGTGCVTRHPSRKNLPGCDLPGFSSLDGLALEVEKKGETALTSQMPPPTASPSKIFTPSRTREGVVGMKAARVGQHLFPIHQGLILFMSMIRQSVIKG